MSTNFPTGIDTFTNPVAGDFQNTPGALRHDTQHDNENDAIHALEVKVGINGSADPTSLDFKTTANATAIGTANSNITAAQNAITALQAQPTVIPIVFTASGSLTAAAVTSGGLVAYALRIRVVGGGGAGGGTVATGAATMAHGAGGAGGSYAESTLLTSGITFPVTITVGAGGVAASGAVGGNGADSSFAALVIGKGGGGGPVGSANAAFIISSGGAALTTGGTGAIIQDGSSGLGGYALSTTLVTGGTGGNAGNGAGGQFGNSGNGTAAGRNASANQGGGGSGAAALVSAAAQIGGNGGSGIVIVEPLFR